MKELALSLANLLKESAKLIVPEGTALFVTDNVVEGAYIVHLQLLPGREVTLPIHYKNSPEWTEDEGGYWTVGEVSAEGMEAQAVRANGHLHDLFVD